MSSRMLLAAFVGLALCHLSSGLVLVPQGQYYLQLSRTNYCNNQDSYLGFSNRTCGTPGVSSQKVAGPIIKSGTSRQKWKQWTIVVKNALGDGSYIVDIYNNFRTNKIKCIGYIGVAKTSACLEEKLATAVGMYKKKTSSWRIVPVPGQETFHIMAEGRGNSCARYLGASGDCNDPYVRLFAKSSTETPQWSIIPLFPTVVKPSSPPPSVPAPIKPTELSPPPSAKLTPPGKPGGINSIYLDSDSWYVTWYDGSAGDPIETYSIKCTTTGGGCGGPTVGNDVSGILRGTEKGEITGLPSGVLDCYIVAQNAAGTVCSDPISITTKGAPYFLSSWQTVTSGLLPDVPGGWEISNDGLTLKYQLQNGCPSVPGPVNGNTQSGQATATLTVGDDDIFINPDMTGLGETYESSFERMVLIVDSVRIIASKSSGFGPQLCNEVAPIVSDPLGVSPGVTLPYRLNAGQTYLLTALYSTIDGAYNSAKAYTVLTLGLPA